MPVKQSILFRLTIVLLSIAILFVLLPIYTTAGDNENDSHFEGGEEDQIVIDPVLPDDDVESESLVDTISKKPGDKALSDLQKMEVDTQSLPEVIDSETAIRKGHVNRIAQQESSLNSIAFQNKDGTKTAYLFSSPVKYFDDEGNVRDKRTTIQPSNKNGFIFAMEDNSVKAFFPKYIDSGVTLEYKGYSLSMTPETNLFSSVFLSSESNTIEYAEVNESGISLQYRPLLNGLKEDIVLNHIPESNMFDFALHMTGLVPKKVNDKWYLYNLTDKVIGEFQTIRIKDSGGKTVIGSMDIITDGTAGSYRVYVTVPLQFLEAEDTVYPVFVDPSVTIWETGGYYEYYNDGSYMYFPYNSIIDTGLYSSPSGVSFAQEETDIHIVGYDEFIYGYGKAIYKLYDFYGDHGQYTQLTDSQIGQVSLKIKAKPWGNSTINANPMTSTWNTNIYGENPIALCDSTLWSSFSTNHSSSKSISSTGEYSIDITEIVQGWARYNAGTSVNNYDNPSYGFLLSNSSTSTCCDITAVEEFYADSVSVVLDYSDYVGEYYINNASFGRFLKNGSGHLLTTSLYESSSRLLWKFEYLGAYEYRIRSLYNSNYVLSKISHDDGVGLTLPSIYPEDYSIWDVRIATGGGIIIKNKATGMVLSQDVDGLKLVSPLVSTDPNYKQTVWRIVIQSNYVNLTSFSVTYPEWMAVGSSQNSQLSVSPTNATWKSKSDFVWTSNNTSVATVDQNGRITAVSNGTVVISAVHKITERHCEFLVAVGQAFAEDTYFIHNYCTKKYMMLGGPTTIEGGAIVQWDFLDSSYFKWAISYCGNGYYYIQSFFNNRYVGVLEGSTSSGSSIIQTAIISDACKWKILKTTSGYYKFMAKCSESYHLVVSIPLPGNTNGTTLVQFQYTDDQYYQDEWVLLKASDYKGSLPYWCSDADTIGYWSSFPSLYSVCLYPDDSFYYDDGYNTAKNQWEDVLDTTFLEVNENTADIKCYGLNPTRYKEMTGYDWEPGDTGLTVSVFSNDGYARYNNEPRFINQQISATVYIIHNSSSPRPLAAIKETVTHELGHALGYKGHSPNSTDVMYAGAHEYYVLKTSEINHLTQIY
ncbi:MAG: RICIN domain-containing protein [Clostridia bacterium]|nr:RICIN domain-containing protein [Clostridia bacterium]